MSLHSGLFFDKIFRAPDPTLCFVKCILCCTFLPATQYTPLRGGKVQPVDNASCISLQLFPLSACVLPVDATSLQNHSMLKVRFIICAITYSKGIHYISKSLKDQLNYKRVLLHYKT